VAYLEFGKGGAWRARRARACNGSLGGALSGVQGQSLWSEGQGAKPPEAETLFAFERSMEAANSPNSCWIMAKNAPFHIKSPVKKFSWLGQRGPP